MRLFRPTFKRFLLTIAVVIVALGLNPGSAQAYDYISTFTDFAGNPMPPDPLDGSPYVQIQRGTSYQFRMLTRRTAGPEPTANLTYTVTLDTTTYGGTSCSGLTISPASGSLANVGDAGVSVTMTATASSTAALSRCDVWIRVYEGGRSHNSHLDFEAVVPVVPPSPPPPTSTPIPTFTPPSLPLTGGPLITNINVSSVTSTGVSITFTTSASAGALIRYGTTIAYGSSNPPLGYTSPATEHLITLGDLNPSTTYHFQIEVSSAAGKTQSADRTFTTTSGTGDPLVLNNIRTDCTNTRCQIMFTPSQPANVQVVWDLNAHAGFSNYPANNIVSDQAGTYSATRRALSIPSTGAFTPDTIYHYRLRAANGAIPSATMETTDFQIRTALLVGDHTFSTGGCTVGNTVIQIGSCGPGGYYCSPGGIAVQSCTQSCGFACPTSSTCRADGNCEVDPNLTGSPFQCNNTSAGPTNCFDDNGEILTPAPAGCYATWGKCNANTILKVRKDRGCNLWLSCGTSIQTEAKVGAPAENLCLTLAACNSLGQGGQCNSYLPRGQCNNDPLRFCATDKDCAAGGTCKVPSGTNPTQALKDLTFNTPTEVKKIANLSGNVIAGLDWNVIGGITEIQGNLPWQLMRQYGGMTNLINGDFEYSPPQTTSWNVIPNGLPSANAKVEYEDQNNSTNHILRVTMVTTRQKTVGTCNNAAASPCSADGLPECPAGIICRIGICTNIATRACSQDSTCTSTGPGNPAGTCDKSTSVTSSGAATETFKADPNEVYFAELRIRAAAEDTPTVAIQFIDKDNNLISLPDGPDAGNADDPAAVQLVARSAWQRVTLGPIAKLSGDVRLAVVCADNATCDDVDIFIDDVQVKPVLQVNTNPSYLMPSCRLYPKEDSPSCDYIDQSGIIYKGWKGYCLENDSVTGTCLSWWPVDIIRGESNLFGSEAQVGYTDRSPLLICAESKGVFNHPDPMTGQTAYAPFLCDSATNDDYSRNRICNAPLLNDQVMTTGVRLEVAEGSGDILGSGDCYFHNDDDSVADWGPCRNGSGLRGFCSSYVGQQETTVNATGADLQIHKYDVDYFRVLVHRMTKGWQNIGNLVEGRLIVGPENQSNPNSWIATAGTPGEQWYSIRLNWNPSTQALVSYTFITGVTKADPDSCDTYAEGIFAIGSWVMREQCTKLVEVVKPGTTAQVYAKRISRSNYHVPGDGALSGELNYIQAQDYTPYGGAVLPSSTSSIQTGEPTTWSQPLNAEAPNSSSVNPDLNPPYQERSGSPYACNGNCQRICNTQYPSVAVTCSSDDDCVGLSTAGGGIDPSEYAMRGDLAVRGRCIGAAPAAASKGAQQFEPHDPTQVSGVANNPFFAQERIRRLFVQSLRSWTLSPIGQYFLDSSVTAPGWGPPTVICGDDPATGKPDRDVPPSPGFIGTAYPNDYCAVPPSIVGGSAQFVKVSGTTATIASGNSINLKFNTDADPEQIPLESFTVDWGDGSNEAPTPYPHAPRKDPANPHVLTHSYDNTGPTCLSGQTEDCCTPSAIGASCTYRIRLHVKDNWGWCENGVSGGNRCPSSDPSTWFDSGLTVQVNP